MKIVYAASEAAGLLKTGGLGDVARALPLALSEKRGQEVSLFLPYYGKMKENEAIRAEKLMDFTVKLSWRKQYCGLYRVKSKKKKRLKNKAEKYQLRLKKQENEHFL